jgi:hypothetical protein
VNRSCGDDGRRSDSRNCWRRCGGWQIRRCRRDWWPDQPDLRTLYLKDLPARLHHPGAGGLPQPRRIHRKGRDRPVVASIYP